MPPLPGVCLSPFAFALFVTFVVSLFLPLLELSLLLDFDLDGGLFWSFSDSEADSDDVFFFFFFFGGDERRGDVSPKMYN